MSLLKGNCLSNDLQDEGTLDTEYTHKDKTMWLQRKRLEWYFYKPKNTKNFWPSPEGMEREAKNSSLLEFPNSMTLISDF